MRIVPSPVTAARPRHVCRFGAGLPLALLLSCVLALVPPSATSSARAEDEPTAAEKAVLLRRMETAYLDLVTDHADQRSGAVARRAAGVPYADLLAAAATAARRDADVAADALLAPLVERSRDSKQRLLSRDALFVVGRRTVAALRRDADLEAGAAFEAALAEVFAADDPAEVWDTCFTDAPTVVLWRRAHASTSAGGEGPGDPAAAIAPTEMVHFERARIEVGPWTGWVAELGDKSTKRHKVTVKALWADVHEVTCAQYREFVVAAEPSDRAELLPEGWTLDDDANPAMPSGRADHPVTGVTYEQASRYAAHLDKRLPSEDEWERIASAGELERSYPWGADPNGVTWVHGDSAGGTQPVTEENGDVTAEGLRGLAGNVAELTATLATRKSIGRGGPEKDEHVVIRGGSYRSRGSECTTRFRWTVEPGETAGHVGFRCVMDEADHKKRYGR